MKQVYTFKKLREPTLLSALLSAAGIPFGMPCGGRGVCKKCCVEVFGSVSAPTDAERAALTEEELQNGIRLACMAYALGDVTVTLTADEYAVPDFEKSVCEGSLPARIGAAIDIGTTTVTAALYDLESGALLRSDTRLNPQSAYGADVISRLQKALEGQGANLQKLICSCIGDMLTSLNPEGKPFEKTVITGNTAMLYLLTNRNPASLTAAPFHADCLFGFSLSETLPLLPDFTGEVYLPPCASAFVGADVVCSALDAADRFGFLDGKACLLADVGTNGEVMLAHDGALLCCSTAAGPAFEGATLFSGSVAKPGAISALSLQNGKIMYTVIGSGKPQSLCGSGAVDAVKVLLEADILDDTGLILIDGHAFTDCIFEHNNASAFRIPDTEVIITQEDIRNIQLAKSAVCAGLMTLMREAALTPDNIDTLIIAGGFGGCIRIASAAAIGLIPAALKDKTVIAGNAALKGARLILLLEESKRKAEVIAAKAITIDLSSSASFFDEYIAGMGF